MKHGFISLYAVIDIYTRYMVAWGISNAMTAQCCL